MGASEVGLMWEVVGDGSWLVRGRGQRESRVPRPQNGQ